MLPYGQVPQKLVSLLQDNKGKNLPGAILSVEELGVLSLEQRGRERTGLVVTSIPPVWRLRRDSFCAAQWPQEELVGGKL